MGLHSSLIYPVSRFKRRGGGFGGFPGRLFPLQPLQLGPEALDFG